MEPKAEVLGYTPGDAVVRQLRFVGYDYPAEGQRDGGFEGIVNLQTEAVVINRIETGQAAIGLADFVAAVTITKADADWQEAMRARGVTDFIWFRSTLANWGTSTRVFQKGIACIGQSASSGRPN